MRWWKLISGLASAAGFAALKGSSKSRADADESAERDIIDEAGKVFRQRPAQLDAGRQTHGLKRVRKRGCPPLRTTAPLRSSPRRAIVSPSSPLGALMRTSTIHLLAGAALAAATLSTPAAAQSHDQHMPMPPQSLAGWAKGAQLFSGLGNFHRRNEDRSPLAQRYFDQGMRFIWAFNHDEATRSFAKAAEIDPTCASCYWGVALTLGPNYNMPTMAKSRARVGWEAVQRAKAMPITRRRSSVR